MLRYPFVTRTARAAAVALGALGFLAGLLVASISHAQTCGVQGPGFQGGTITQILQVKRSTEALQPLPRNPISTGYGYNIYVDAILQMSGYCEDLDWNGSSCVVDGTWLNDTSRLVGVWTRPSDPPGQDNTSFEYAINPNGSTAHVQFMDSRDDTTTAPGPVTVMPSSPSGVGAGTYTHRTKANVSETPCDPPGVDIWLASDTAAKSFPVTHTDNAKDICEPGGPGDGADRQGNPCSARSGNKWEREVDSDGPVLPFVRHYSSLSMFDIGLGWGWSSDYHGRMLTPLTTHLNVVRPSGHAQVFGLNGPSASLYSYVVNNPTNLIDPSGLRVPWYFPGIGGDAGQVVVDSSCNDECPIATKDEDEKFSYGDVPHAGGPPSDADGVYSPNGTVKIPDNYTCTVVCEGDRARLVCIPRWPAPSTEAPYFEQPKYFEPGEPLPPGWPPNPFIE